MKGGEHGNALQAASVRGDDKIVRLLLENGADVNAQSGEYGNSLCAASYWGRDQTVQKLLENGADVNMRGEYGNALQAASRTGHDLIAQKLLGIGLDLRKLEGEYDFVLQAASAGGHYQIVQQLLERGAMHCTRPQLGATKRPSSYSSIMGPTPMQNVGNIAPRSKLLQLWVMARSYNFCWKKGRT